MKRDLFDLAGKVAIIGGAGEFGKVMAQSFARFGADVVCADIDPNAAKKAADIVRKEERESLDIRCDVSSQNDIDNLLARTMEKFGTVDILVNGVGLCKHVPTTEFPMEDWLHIIDATLTGTFRCCQTIGRIMVKNRKGSIINISSIIGLIGSGRGHSAYAAAKGGINALTRELAVEWAPFGVRVNAIAPCQFNIELVKKALSDMPNPDEILNRLISEIPMGRLGRSEEIAGTAVYLASEASSMVTGHIVHLDGGRLAR